MDSQKRLENTDIINIDEELRKEEELLNTIKMEPILEKTVIDEEVTVNKKKKMMRVTDYILLSLIIILSVIFIFVIIKVR
jgi:cell division protein FtsX